MFVAHRSVFKFLVDQVFQQQDRNQGFAGALDLSTRLFCVSGLRTPTSVKHRYDILLLCPFEKLKLVLSWRGYDGISSLLCHKASDREILFASIINNGSDFFLGDLLCPACQPVRELGILYTSPL